MKILHVCLAAFYIEGYAYQENILPRKHKQAGHEVNIVASCETYVNNQKLGYVKACRYVNNDGIQVTRLPYIRYIPLAIVKKLRIYAGLDKYLESIQPDFIFLHDIQFLSLKQIVEYKKKHTNVVIVADGHADYINSARGVISKEILHKLVYRYSIRNAEKYIDKFYGTLPPRNDFMKEMYGIPAGKLEYLPLGVDDDKICGLSHEKDREDICAEYGIDKDNFIIVTGGKFDQAKSAVLSLINAIYEMEKCALIIFGSFDSKIGKEAEKKYNERIMFVGWKSEYETMRLMSGADLAVFPYLHSTLWEQTAGIGTPMLVKKIDGFSHININGNCRFIESCDTQCIKESISKCIDDRKLMSRCALSVKDFFAYSRIAQKVIEDNT